VPELRAPTPSRQHRSRQDRAQRRAAQSRFDGEGDERQDAHRRELEEAAGLAVAVAADRRHVEQDPGGDTDVAGDQQQGGQVDPQARRAVAQNVEQQ
jgi:hypothetical protein